MTEDLRRLSLIAKEKDSPAYGAFLLLKEHEFSRPDYRMEGPFPVISRDGEYAWTKPKFEADFHAAYQNVLMWAVTGDACHAETALAVLGAYADTLRKIPDTNDAPLLAGLQGTEIICALEILKHTYTNACNAPGAACVVEKAGRMFREIFLPVLAAFRARPPYTNGNWGLIYAKAMMAAGIYFDEAAMYGEAKDFYLNAHDNGTIARYTNETGQMQESGRDQGHCFLGLGNMAVVCEIAWKQGDDLYAALDNRLLKAYEYMAKYNLGGDVPFTKWKDVTGKYSEWETISTADRGNFRPVFEIAWNHYAKRRGLAMPYTEQVLKTIRPEGFDKDQPPGFGSFLYAQEGG